MLLVLALALRALAYNIPPRVVPVAPDDPNYSLPMKTSTVPFSIVLGASIFAPVPLLWVYARQHKKPLATVRSYATTGILASMFTCSIVENTKNIVGRPRPDFLARCRPDATGQCTGPAHLVREGRKSFPSGHTAQGFCVCGLFFYFVFAKRLWSRTVLMVGVLLCAAASLVGFSRIHDHRHAPSDVLAGALFGLCTAAAFAIPVLARERHRELALPQSDATAEDKRSMMVV